MNLQADNFFKKTKKKSKQVFGETVNLPYKTVPITSTTSFIQ